MGCTPSHSHIVNSVIAKSGIQFLKKPKAILPEHQAGSDRCPIPWLIQNATCYDSGGTLAQRQRLLEGQPNFREPQTATEDQLPEDATSSNRKDMGGRLIPDTRTFHPQWNKSQRHMAQGILFKPQSSHGSQGTAFSGEESEDSNTQETSKGERKPRHHRSDRQHHCCQTTLLAPASEGKMDFPEPLVQAHQHAYSYLHSSLSKYEAVLCLAHQVTQTQELLQPMVSFLLQCCDEVNQLLGEISKEGDVLLQEVREDLAWPLCKGKPWEQPDLLRQLLQYTVSKLQALGSSVASLTSSLLQGSGGYLQATASHLAGKLSAKRGVDACLLITLGQLESLASGPSAPEGQGVPFCSEDSGIGVDSEPGQPVDKLSKLDSWDSVSEPTEWKTRTLPTVEAGPSGQIEQQRPLWVGSDRPLDSPLSRLLATKIQPTAQGAAGSPRPSSTVPENISSRTLRLNDHTLAHSLRLGLSVEAPLSSSSRVMGTLSLSKDDSSPEEVNGINSCAGQETACHPRPRSSPARSESTFQPCLKSLRGPQAQEMILKMKRAISERIKFVPVLSGQQDWAEEEERTSVLPPRPSTVSGSRRGPPRQRRSRSESCLGNQAEDLTVQELQRVQKDLNQRLEVFFTTGTAQPGHSKGQAPQPRAVALRVHGGRGTPGSTISKLKASLGRNFSILPSQDKAILQKRSPHPAGDWPRQGNAEGLPQAPPASEKASEASGLKDRNIEGPPTRISVKKLIETFSPIDSLRTLGDAQDSQLNPSLKKWRVPILPPRFPIYRGLAPLYSKPQISATERGFPKVGPEWRPSAPLFPSLLTARVPESREPSTDREEDPELLPPPPPEILMDKSFTSLEPPESAQLTRNSPQGFLVPGLGGAGPARRMWASPKLRASLGPAYLLPSRSTAMPTRSRSTGPGSNRGVYNAARLASDLHHLPATIQNLEGVGDRAQRQVQVGRAPSLSKHSWKALPWHYASHTSAHSRTSESSLARPMRGPHAPEATRKNQERSPAVVRKPSPTREHWAPQMNKKHLSLTSAPRPAQSSSSSVHSSPSPPFSPPISPRELSPPTVKKQGSPPPQHRLPSPPLASPPAQHKVSCPPTQRTGTKPPSLGPSPSPPVSPPQGCKERRNSADSPAATAKASGNTRSIFCPATSSLFEATAPWSAVHLLAPPLLPPETGSPQGSPTRCRRNHSEPRQKVGSQRGAALCALSPQPFIRRTASDHRPGLRLPLPVSGTSRCVREFLLAHHSSSEESLKRDAEPWSSPCALERKSGSRGASPPEFCVLGHRLHWQASSNPALDKPQQEAQLQQKEVV